MKMKKTCFALAGLAVLSLQAGGTFEGFEKPEDLPGAVSMVWTGKEVLADVSGYADLATKRPVSTNDLFWIASNTKAIACALMLREIDKGLVKLDAPVADYLPEWKDIRIKGGKAPKHAPTVREVMGHTAGLAFFPKMPITQFSVQELAHMAVTNGLDHDVGEYLYSNWGIDVAMAVVERVTGKPWEQSLQDEVLDPLGMKDTTFFPTVKDYETRMAKSYRFDPYCPKWIPGEMYVDQLVFPYDKPGTHAEAGGGLFATASDLLAFFRMVASRGKLPDGRQFISERLMEEWYGLTDFYKGKKYTFGMDARAERGFVRHGGAYNTDGAANWKRGTARVFMTQISMWTARSVARRRQWEDYAAQWLDVKADRVWRNNIAWFGAKPDAPSYVNAKAIQKAIDECVSSGGAGEVTIPKGVYQTDTYHLRGDVTFKFEDGAKLERVKDRVVTVAAHPDDMAGQMGLALLLAKKCDLHVIDFTHGERGCGEEKFRNGWTKAARTKEEEKVCAGIGATLHWMDEIDGEAMAGRETCERLAKLFKQIQPRAVILHWPIDIHNDHVMSAAASLRALQMAGVSPEIYFQEQGHQSRGFTPCYYVPVDEVAARKAELTRLYVAQNGDRIAENKLKLSEHRGNQCFGYGDIYTEAYAVMQGTVRAGEALLEELPGVSH